MANDERSDKCQADAAGDLAMRNNMRKFSPLFTITDPLSKSSPTRQIPSLSIALNFAKRLSSAPSTNDATSGGPLINR